MVLAHTRALRQLIEARDIAGLVKEVRVACGMQWGRKFDYEVRPAADDAAAATADTAATATGIAAAAADDAAAATADTAADDAGTADGDDAAAADIAVGFFC